MGFKFRVVALVICLFTGWTWAAEQKQLNGRTFEKNPLGWVQLEQGTAFVVDSTILSVRLNPEIESWQAFREAWLAMGGDSELANMVSVRSNHLGIHDLEIQRGQDPINLAERFVATGLVIWAEPTTLGSYVALPSDPSFPTQWHLRNTGQSGGTVDADIDADEAWDIETGDPSIVVGILDSGTDIDHQDLLANLWKNTGEIPGNGKDDDGNGFVDDYDGWDFEGNDGNPRSTNAHGTQVAGVVAARTDNGTNTAGVAGGFGANDGASLMPVKVGTAGPIGSILDDAIIYAADNGAQIITLSLTVGASSAINDALDYAYNTKGVFIDCASGNSGAGFVGYPSSNINVMAVGSTTRNDVRSSFSQYGSDLEIVAPGSSITTTTIGNGISTVSGTSFAAPNVAGVAALVLSRNPSTTNVALRQRLKDTADDLGDPGADLFYGSGRVNAKSAIDATPPPTCIDGDGDGYYPFTGCGTEIDCNDNDDMTYPGAPEICGDGIDQDCDGLDKTKGKGCGGGGGSGGGDKEGCKNGVDDDGDGLVDCLDPDCASKKFCL